MSTASDWHRRRQEEWDERHRQWAREQREREEREGTDYWKAAQPKTQSFFDWSESERAAEAARRADELRQAAEATRRGRGGGRGAARGADEPRRPAEAPRRGREEMNRLLEEHVAQMGGSGSVPP